MKRRRWGIGGRAAACGAVLVLSALPARPEIVTGGTLYVSVNAAQITGLNEGELVSTWANQGNGGIPDFTTSGAVFGGMPPIYSTNVAGVPAVTFTGAAGEHLATWGTGAPTDVTGNDSFTAEAWAFNPAFNDHETILNWAHRGTVLRYATLSYGFHGTWGAVGHWDWPDMGFDTGNPLSNAWHHIAATFDRSIERVYVDGRLSSIEGKHLDLWPWDAFVIGASQNAAMDNVEVPFSGSLGAVRLHGEALSGLAVVTNYLNDNAIYGQAGVADDAYWANAGTADWGDDASWAGGVAPTGRTVIVGNGGTVAINGAATARMAVIERGRLRIDGGSLTAGFQTVIGAGAGNEARLDVNAGSLVRNGANLTVVGETDSTGTVVVASGAAIDIQVGGIRVGAVEGTGVVTNRGTITSTGDSIIGWRSGAGSGTVAMEGGTWNKVDAGNFVLGDTGGRGLLTIDTTSLLNIPSNELWIGTGAGSTGTVIDNGGAITAGNWIVVGRWLSTGTLRMNGGLLTKYGANNTVVGDNGGTGVLVLENGATVNLAAGPYWQAHMANARGYVTNHNSTLIKQAASVFAIGRADGAVGYYVQNGAQSVTAVSNGWISIGENGAGKGYFVVNDGRLFHGASDFNIADIGTSRGYYEQHGGTATVNRLLVGKNAATAGFFTLDGGLFIDRDGSGDSVVGGFNNLSNTYGSITIRGGRMEHYDNLQVGGGGLGVFEQSGGSFHHAAGYPVFGRYVTGVGVAHLSGGTFTRAANELLIVGEAGTGVLTVAGSAFLVSTAAVSVGHAATGVGVVNLDGGTMAVSNLFANNAAAISLVNFNGGTLRPVVSTTTFLSGMDAATVFAGGAVIDTDGKDVTIDQALTPAAGNGVASIPVADGGSGYAGPPIVILSGDGMGATAYAEINPASGAVTNIVVTCPGWGYFSPPTVEFFGGDGTGAAAGAVTLAPNVDGGLVKNGAGTLTLTGDNTYTGPTVVSNGTLSVVGALSGGGPVTVRGTLAGSGAVAGQVTVEAGGAIAPGAGGPGTLTINNHLALNGAAVLNYELGSSSDFMVVNGSVTLGGKVRITATSGFGAGNYMLFQYSGALTGPLPTVETSPAGYDCQVSTNIAGVVMVVASVHSLTPFELWQVQYFASTNNPNGAPGADADGDLQTNLQEFRAGTNPTNQLSALRLVQEARSGNDVVLTWTTAGIRTNQIEVCGDLATAAFTNLGARVVIPTEGDAVTNYVDLGAATNTGPRFYRVRLADP